MKREQDYFTNYWLDSIDRDLVMTEGCGSSTSNLIYKNKLKRGVDNFVRALSKKSIPIQFMDNWETAATDFKTIFIPGNISDKNFDIVIGLALHEAAHNLYSKPFMTKDEFVNYLKNHKLDIYKLLKKKYIIFYKNGLYNDKYDFDYYTLGTYYTKVFHPLVNIIEDRRIDNLAFHTAPGYRGYYQALYNKYFINRGINNAIRDQKFINESWDSYIFHLTNFVNPNRQLKSLKYLPWLWNKVDLKNMDRLKSTDDVISLVFEIIKFLETNTIPVEKQDDQKPEQQQPSDQQQGNGEDQEQQPSDQQQGNGEDQEDGSDQNNNDSQPDDQTIEDNKNFNSNESNKEYNNAKKLIVREYEKVSGISKLSKADRKRMKVIENTNTTELEVILSNDYSSEPTKIKVFEYFVRQKNSIVPGISLSCPSERRGQAYQRGLNIGKRLAKKLILRNEDRSVIYSRLKRGRIDSRLIAEIGYGNEKIMNRTITTTYNPSFIHISIDNSGSMGGSRIHESIVTATAIAVACSIVGSVDVQISIRTTNHQSNREGEVFISYIYDSRIHDLNHLKYYMSRIECPGTTPEGLVFGSILNQLNKIPNNVDKYFINISDGTPQINRATDRTSLIRHTKEMVGKIRKTNTKILSYMIQNQSERFKEMYGKSAEYIDESNIFEIAKTINKHLLQSK